MNYKTAACGMYSTRVDAQKAVDQLRAEGFQAKDIVILGKKNNSPHDFVHAQPSSIRKGALIGALVGSLLVGFFMFFSGANSSGSTATALSGAVMGAFLGLVAGALCGIGIPMLAKRRYGFYLREGGLLLAVHTENPDERQKAIQVLNTNGAQDVSDLYDAQVWELGLQV
ncbi:MAG: hypothetical protein A2622_10850 [Bdellovibrionales bacterium RIFCSPHIGHO2_01_FULL_40_29]|nr:MAG: hypothetical protein A2622_10850 [Bdellovibrionales bacterium RIFCSPHIGHO2_01_FULL_40_29]OFZ34454.1 MAG: hypothetical protein A3D17_01115 [Bdellovibrionales bacterium RIFCSPHIGHO2_02_FULL_40_15]